MFNEAKKTAFERDISLTIEGQFCIPSLQIKTRLVSVFRLYIESSINNTWAQYSWLYLTWRGQQVKRDRLEAEVNGT